MSTCSAIAAPHTVSLNGHCITNCYRVFQSTTSLIVPYKRLEVRVVVEMCVCAYVCAYTYLCRYMSMYCGLFSMFSSCQHLPWNYTWPAVVNTSSEQAPLCKGHFLTIVRPIQGISEHKCVSQHWAAFSLLLGNWHHFAQHHPWILTGMWAENCVSDLPKLGAKLTPAIAMKKRMQSEARIQHVIRRCRATVQGRIQSKIGEGLHTAATKVHELLLPRSCDSFMENDESWESISASQSNRNFA